MTRPIAAILISLAVLSACSGDNPTSTPEPPQRSAAVATTPPTAAPTATSRPTSAPTATKQPTVAPAPATATPAPVGPRIASNANLRAGPGTTYPIAGSAAADTSVEIIAADPTGQWYLLANGAWIAAFLIVNAPASLPIVTVQPPPTVAAVATEPAAQPTTAPAPAGVSTLGDIRLIVIRNAGTFEILEIHNTGPVPIDISGWQLYGSKGDDGCQIPAGIVVQPGQGYQVATGDSQPALPGLKCGDKTIWNNEGETIFLRTIDGQTLEIRT